jgi:hypothetical protein
MEENIRITDSLDFSDSSRDLKSSLLSRKLTWGRILSGILIVSCVVSIGALFILFDGGIRVGTTNHFGLMPVVRRILNPDYLPGDFSISLRLYHHRTFAYMLAGLTFVFGEDKAIITFHVLSRMLLSFSLFYLCRTLKHSLLDYLVLGLLIATGAAWLNNGLEVNTFIGHNGVQPPIFAHSFILLGIASLLQRRYKITALLAGIVVLFHVQIGLIFLLLLAPFYLRNIKKFSAIDLGQMFFLFLIPALPSLIFLSRMIKAGVGSSSYSVEYIQFRQAHHFDINPMGAMCVAIYFIIQIVVFYYFYRTKNPNGYSLGVLTTISLGLIILALVHYMDYRFLKNGFAFKLQFIRLSSLIPILGVLVLIKYIKNLDTKLSTVSQQVLIVASCAIVMLLYFVINPSMLNGTKLSNLVSKHTDQRSIAWVDMCLWINDHGEIGTVYLTPPGNEGFTYLSNRSNVVEFKINPDGGFNTSEWYERLSNMCGGDLPKENPTNSSVNWLPRMTEKKHDLNNAYFKLGPDQLVTLGEKYDARFAILPNTSSHDFETLYQNDSYKLVRLPTKHQL